jgi:hypothetical protein
MWTGSRWSRFGRTPNGINNQQPATSIINAIAVSGTNVYIGGNFNRVSSSTQNNVSANNIAIWNGSVWSGLGTIRTTTQIGLISQNGTNNAVNTITASGTNVYIGGDFTTASSLSQQSISANRVAVWNGSVWSRVGDPNILDNGPNYTVNNIELDNYNNIYVGGNFTKVTDSTQTIPANNLAIWNGSKWYTLKSSSDNGPNKTVNTIKVSATNIYIGGDFNQVTDSTQTILSNNIFFL